MELEGLRLKVCVSWNTAFSLVLLFFLNFNILVCDHERKENPNPIIFSDFERFIAATNV